MATFLLDTSVIFDHLNGRYGRTEFLDQLIEQGHVLACCPVNISEVYASLRSGEETKTAAFMNSLECLRRGFVHWEHFPMPELHLLLLPAQGQAG